ncbi:pumilio-like protein 24-like [Senna tora]|uniref:Pumilio-like protein 24-like n=1 Tax=Senna tora TaxID=362788 RepID=A0A834SCD8_9FABA|nr:pumilio-like protein 24-like [Senna tora]
MLQSSLLSDLNPKYQIDENALPKSTPSVSYLTLFPSPNRRLLSQFSSPAANLKDIIQQLSSPLLVRMIGTKDGAKLGIVCVKQGVPRKKIIKGMKCHIDKIAYHQHGCMVLVCIISVVDDTKLITKAIIRELQQILKELVLNKNGRRPLLQLLDPNCSHYFSPNDLAPLNSYKPSLSVRDHSEVSSQTETSKVEEPGDDEPKEDIEVTADEANKHGDNSHLVESGKKDPIIRRQELLIKSGLGEGK